MPLLPGQATLYEYRSDSFLQEISDGQRLQACDLRIEFHLDGTSPKTHTLDLATGSLTEQPCGRVEIRCARETLDKLLSGQVSPAIFSDRSEVVCHRRFSDLHLLNTAFLAPKEQGTTPRDLGHEEQGVGPDTPIAIGDDAMATNFDRHGEVGPLLKGRPRATPLSQASPPKVFSSAQPQQDAISLGLLRLSQWLRHETQKLKDCGIDENAKGTV
jgi:hypothetical protein